MARDLPMIANPTIPKSALLAHSARLAARALFWAPPTIRRFERARAEQRGADNGSRPRILFYYSQVPWQEVWQRPQEVALGLADYLPVVYLSPLQVQRIYDSVPDWRREWTIDRGHGVRVVQPLILPGEYKSPRIAALNRRLVRGEACAALDPAAELVFFSNSPFSAPLLDGFDWSQRIYDAIDDFPGFSWAPPWARPLEDRWLAEADLVFSGTHALAEKHKAKRGDIEFVPCGVRFERFNEPAGEAPEELRGLPHPLLGYVGTVSDRLDRALLERLAAEFRGGSIVLIGPVHGSFDRPRGVSNLHLLGPRPHERLPAYVQQFDLALMPFAINAATEAINPVKTLEYLAAGRIVVSTAIPDVIRFFSEEVAIGRDPDEFVQLARHWLDTDCSPQQQRGIDRARRSSWRGTVRRIAERMGLTPLKEG